MRGEGRWGGGMREVVMVVGAGGAGKDRKRKRKRGDSTQKAWEPAKQGRKSRLGPELTGEKRAEKLEPGPAARNKSQGNFLASP